MRIEPGSSFEERPSGTVLSSQLTYRGGAKVWHWPLGTDAGFSIFDDDGHSPVSPLLWIDEDTLVVPHRELWVLTCPAPSGRPTESRAHELPGEKTFPPPRALIDALGRWTSWYREADVDWLLRVDVRTDTVQRIGSVTEHGSIADLDSLGDDLVVRFVEKKHLRDCVAIVDASGASTQILDRRWDNVRGMSVSPRHRWAFLASGLEECVIDVLDLATAKTKGLVTGLRPSVDPTSNWMIWLDEDAGLQVAALGSTWDAALGRQRTLLQPGAGARITAAKTVWHPTHRGVAATIVQITEAHGQSSRLVSALALIDLAQRTVSVHSVGVPGVLSVAWRPGSSVGTA